MEFGELVEYNAKNIFPQKSARKWGRETGSRPIFYILKSFLSGQSKWSGHLHLVIIQPNKSKLYNWFREILNFDFLWKGQGLASPAYFVLDFSRKSFFMLYSINWPNFIFWLPLLLDILGNMCNVINLSFLIKEFSHMTRKVGIKN